MRTYRNVATYIWNDDKFPFASDDCQLVWFHIFTNPSSSPMGIFRASLHGLAEDKNRNGCWPFERYEKAFREGIEKGFLKYDPKALLIAFPKYFSRKYKCNHPQSPNVIQNWAERFSELPSSPLKDECIQALKALAEGLGEAFVKAFSKGIANPEPEPEPEPEKGIDGGKQPPPPAKGAAVWDAYSGAFEKRYGVKPIRDARVNSMFAKLVDRLGKDAPAVAGFYLSVERDYYLAKRHPSNLLLSDCETLRTQWATGKRTDGDLKLVSAKCRTRVKDGRFLKDCGKPTIALIGGRPVCQEHKEDYERRNANTATT